jgi:hypothetical protein
LAAKAFVKAYKSYLDAESEYNYYNDQYLVAKTNIEEY